MTNAWMWLLISTVYVPNVAIKPDSVPTISHFFRLHEQAVHQELNRQAVRVVQTNDADRRYAEIYTQTHSAQLVRGGFDEDEGTASCALTGGLPRPVNHFYHPLSREGLPGLNCTTDAVSWAYDSDDDLTWAGALEAYGDTEDSKRTAYLRLGHVAHLLGDMAQPDHVHLEPHLHGEGSSVGDVGRQWEPWAVRTLNSGGTQLMRTSDPPAGGGGAFHVNDFFHGMASISYDRSSFAGVLYGRESNPAEGEIAQMFDISYELILRTEDEKGVATDTYGWVVRNKREVDPSRRIIAYWNGRSTSGGGVTVGSGGGVTHRPDLRHIGTFYDICTEGTVLPCFKSGVPSRFYIEDIAEARPAIYGGQPNRDGQRLASFFVKELWPKAVQHIAGLYMHFHDVVNPPPYVREVQVDQRGAKYHRKWERDPQAQPGTIRRRLTDVSPSKAVSLKEPANLTITFSEPVEEVRIQIGNSKQLQPTASPGAADSVWTLRLDPERDLAIADRDSAELSIRIWAKDLQQHLSGRTPRGDALDATPATGAKATYRGPNDYPWRDYTEGADESHKLILSQPDVVLFLLDVSGSMAGAKIQQARASGIQNVQTLRTNRDSAGSTPVASVAVFGGGCETGAARTVLDFTDDLARVEQTFRSGIPSPGGATPLHIARGEAEEMIERYARANGGGRTDIVLLSDGMDTCESTRPAGTYSRAVSGQATSGGNAVRYLAVGFDLPPGSPAERDLQYLASLSGGRYFNARDQRQLTRSFEKLLKIYVPRTSTRPGTVPPAGHAAFNAGSTALARRAYEEAREAFQTYTDAHPQDAAGHYNLAQALEATDRYRAAAAAYRRYLAAAPQAADRIAVQAMLPVLERDYQDHFAYQVELIRSDLAYLQNYYDRLFNQDNASLAAEFRGFVLEKGEFYANLSDVLEIEAPWVEQAERDVGQSIQRLARRVDSPTFDRDAVSLLAVPIGHLEELVQALSAHRPGR